MDDKTPILSIDKAGNLSQSFFLLSAMTKPNSVRRVANEAIAVLNTQSLETKKPSVANFNTLEVGDEFLAVEYYLEHHKRFQKKYLDGILAGHTLGFLMSMSATNGVRETLNKAYHMARLHCHDTYYIGRETKPRKLYDDQKVKRAWAELKDVSAYWLALTLSKEEGPNISKGFTAVDVAYHGNMLAYKAGKLGLSKYFDHNPIAIKGTVSSDRMKVQFPGELSDYGLSLFRSYRSTKRTDNQRQARRLSRIRAK